MSKEKNPLDKITKADKERLTKATYILSSRARFMQWATSFQKHEIESHPWVRGVRLLSFSQSSRFAIGVHNGEAFLGVQKTEIAWLQDMPLDQITVDDMLYLTASSVECIGQHMQSFTIGIRTTNQSIIEQIKRLDYIRFVEIEIYEGRVANVREEFREPVMLCSSRLKDSLSALIKETQKNNKSISFL